MEDARCATSFNAAVVADWCDVELDACPLVDDAGEDVGVVGLF